MLRQILEIGSKVILDKDFRNGGEVTVISQTSGKLFTTVEYDGSKWDVMTRRLTKIIDSDM